MDELIRQTTSGMPAGAFGLYETLVTLFLSFALCLVIAYFYRQTHRGLSYSVSFVHTMILNGVTVSIIMLIIGSNIARAFALVGALSIVRYRHAVKDSRDIAYIFLTMAVGMATGTGFYTTAIVVTLFASAMMYFLNRFGIGAATVREVLLKVHAPVALDYHTAFDEVFYRYLKDSSLLSVETIQQGTLHELVYAVEFRSGADEAAFLKAIRTQTGEQKVVLLAGQENINV